jgi:hypothetical protein
MSTTTVSNGSIHSVTTTGLHAYLEFIKTHERIVVAALILGVALCLGNRYIDHSADAAIAKNAAAQQVLQTQVEANAKLAAIAKESADRYATLLAQVTAQNQTLLATIAQRNAAVVVQQKELATLPLTEVGVRWAALLQVGSPEVQSTEKGILVSDSVSRKTVGQLELVPVLQANVRDQETMLANKDKQIDGQAGIITDINNEVNGLKLQIVDGQKACTAQVNKINATSHRSKRNWFLRGLAGGAAVATYLALVL